ncbi:MAG: tetratricopeptide repeat protein [Nitrospirae bacterium]|nr:MAG: tetratricopeptide repeat protein [Nitrospirota bacterium]
MNFCNQGRLLYICFTFCCLLVFSADEAGAYPGQTANRTIRIREGARETAAKIFYRVTSVQEAESVGDGVFGLKPEGKFIIVRFKAVNKGPAPVPAHIVSDIYLSDGKGALWKSSARASGLLRLGTDGFAIMELDKGKEIEDVAVFDIPAKNQQYLVRFPSTIRNAREEPMPKDKDAPAKIKEKEKALPKEQLAAQTKTTKTQPAVKETKPEQAEQLKKGPQAAKKQEAVRPTEDRTEDKPERSAPLKKDTSLQSPKKCDMLEEKIKKAEEKEDLPDKGRLHYYAAECYAANSNFTTALRHLDETESIGKTLGNPELDILSVIGKGRISFASGHKEKAAEIFRTAAEKAEREVFQSLWASDYTKALISVKLAGVYLELSAKETAKERLDQALLINSDFKLEEEIFSMLKLYDPKLSGKLAAVSKSIESAWTAFEKTDYKGMEKFAAEALDKAKKVSAAKGVFDSEYALATALDKKGETDNAIGYAMHAQGLADKGGDITRANLINNLLGKLLRQKKSYQPAVAALGKTLANARETGNKREEAATLTKIGQTQMEMGEYREALEHFKQALKIALDANALKQTIAHGYLNMGSALKKLEQYDKAEKSMSIALDLYKKTASEEGELTALWEMADNRALQSDFEVAVKILEQNLGRAKKAGLKKTFVESLLDYAFKAKDKTRTEKYKRMRTE